ncbi:MAG TPA: CAP domain-containing protein [Thermoanaerobaculia bacterium]|jgi:uncharacterized protein YkwD
MFPLAVIFLLVSTVQALPVIEGPPSPETIREELLARFNQERTAAGALPLKLAEPLNQVAQENAEEVRVNEGVAVYDERSIPKISRRLRKAGYEAHGWHQAFAAGPDEPAALVAWIREQYPETFRSLMDPDFQELGIGISEIRGTPLYDFFLAWRESESFARQTASLVDLALARADMLARANAERTAAGLPPLALDPRLNEAAQRHAEDMLLRSYYNHSSPEGNGPSDRVRKSGYTAQLVGENIARGPVTVNEAMDNWLASREHRRNLLNPGFRDLGVGIAVGRNSVGYTVLWVQDFGRPIG